MLAATHKLTSIEAQKNRPITTQGLGRTAETAAFAAIRRASLNRNIT
jgi:hypothetical protein